MYGWRLEGAIVHPRRVVGDKDRWLKKGTVGTVLMVALGS